jgi:hypothetical protein
MKPKTKPEPKPKKREEPQPVSLKDFEDAVKRIIALPKNK